MVAWLLYLGITSVIGIVLAFFLSLFRSSSKHDVSPARTFLGCFLFAVFGPFLYVEITTKVVGEKLHDVVAKGYDASPLIGPIQYSKITWYTGKKARVLVVAEEKDKWGGKDRPVLELNLSNADGNWQIDSSKVLICSRLDQDGLVFPPYQ